MPVVRDALQRLEVEVASSVLAGIKVLVLIHGYGSTGTGGDIKKAVHRKLRLYMDQKKITDILPGEECGKQSAHAKHMMKRFPMLSDYLLRMNPGITIVVF